MMCEDQKILPLPKDKLPACWDDEERINVLFAPFRNRSVNPKDWESKLSFWKSLISTLCLHNKIIAFKLADLHVAFNRNGRYPSCLDVVIEDMLKCRELKPIGEFLQFPQNTWSGWATDTLVKKPISWSYNKIKGSIVTPAPIGVLNYVHLATVENEAEQLLSIIPDNIKNKVVNLQELIEIIGADRYKPYNLKLLLHYLVCQGSAFMKQIDKGSKTEIETVLIKIGDKKNMKPISQVDISIHGLECNERTLTKNLETLENELGKLIVDAKSYLVKGHRQMAKSCLRKKHEIDSRILKRANALQNVQTLLCHLHDADTDAQVLDTYKQAVSTLKTSFKEAGLSEDSVADTITDIGEVLDIHDDIQTILSQSVSGNDTDFEEELAELIASDTKPEFPKPPSNNVDTSDIDDLDERLKALRSTLPDVPASSPILQGSKISL